MSNIAVQGGAGGTGTVTLLAPSTSTDRTLTLPDSTGTVATAESTLSQFNASGSAPVYACRAWVNFNGTGTVAIRASGNVSSITDNGVGQYVMNFTTAMPDLNYATVGSAWYSGVSAILFSNEATPSSTTSKAISTNNAGATSNSDASYISVSIFR